MIITTNSEKETINLGKTLGGMLSGGELVALIGDLGGGKTQFTKGLGAALGVTEPIVSPTFTIERIYEGSKFVLHHFDFYRIGVVDKEIEDEISELTADDKNVVAIEWAYNLESVLPKDYLEVRFTYEGDDKRQIEFVGHGKRYEQLIEGIK